MKVHAMQLSRLLLALLLFFLAVPVMANPSGTYSVQLRRAANTPVYSMDLKFGPGNKVTVSDQGNVGSGVGKDGAFYRSGDTLLMLFFPDHFLDAPKTTFIGKLANGAWQGTMCDQVGTPVGWIAKKKGEPLTAPNNFGSSVSVIPKSFSGTEQYSGQTIPLKLRFATGGSGSGISILQQSSGDLAGRVAAARYPASSEQLVVLGLPGHRVYGGIVKQEASGGIKLEGIWYNYSVNANGTFKISSP